MKRNVSAIVCALILCAMFAFAMADAEVIFSKRVAAGRGELVIQTSDGGYLLIGRIIGPNFDGFAVKLDASGRQVWKRRFKGPANITGSTMLMLNRAVEIADGYVVAGPVISEKGHVALLKLDRSGNLKWMKSIDPVAFEAGNFGGSLAPTIDGGFIFSGVDLPGTVNKSLLAIKFNASGSILWQKAYGFAANATSIFQTADGGYLLAGGPDGSEVDSTHFALLRLGSTGSVRWKKLFSIPQFNTFGHCILLKDGGYALVAFNSAKHTLVVRLSSAGAVLWSKFYGDSEGNSDRTSIAQTTDGGLVVGADGVNGSLVFKLDTSGNILWKREFGSSREGFQTYSIISTSNGGSAVAGWLHLFITGGHDYAYMIQFDSAGRTACGTFGDPSLPMATTHLQGKSQPVPVKIPKAEALAESIRASTSLASLTSFCPCCFEDNAGSSETELNSAFIRFQLCRLEQFPLDDDAGSGKHQEYWNTLAGRGSQPGDH